MGQEGSSSDGLSREYRRLARGFQMNGFVVIRAFFSRREVHRLRDRLSGHLAAPPESLPDEAVIRADDGSDRIVILAKLDRHDAMFADLIRDARLQRLATQLLGSPATAAHVDFINKQRGVAVTRPHQDAYIFTRLPSESLTFWLALDSIDARNGCLSYVRGSHWGMYRPHDTRPGPNMLVDYRPSDRAREVQVHVAPGDVAAHHSFTIHRSEPNWVDRPRWALAIPFLREGARLIPKHEWIALHERSRASEFPTRLA